MAWHLGYPLSQTLFTSVYAEALLMPTPFSVGEARFVRNAPNDSPSRSSMLEILRAYCLGLLKACGYVNERIRSEHYYEVSIITASDSKLRSDTVYRRKTLSQTRTTGPYLLRYSHRLSSKPSKKRGAFWPRWVRKSVTRFEKPLTGGYNLDPCSWMLPNAPST